jgi:hypothetical protein
MMGIEAAEGPAHGGPRAHHRAVDVDRQARQGQALDRLDDEVMVEADQRGQGRLRELTQPVADGAARQRERQHVRARS